MMQRMQRLRLQPPDQKVEGSKPLASGQRQQAGFNEVALILLEYNRRLLKDKAADEVEFR
jgi:hypothetical protein